MRNQTTYFFFGIIFFLTLLACAGGKSTKKDLTQTPHSKLQNMHVFDPYWREIDSLLDRGLPKSALKRINEIESEIRESKHSGQLVKWVKTKVSTLQNIEENSDWKNYQRFKIEIPKSKTPAKQVLQYYLAEYLKKWTQRNQWKIRQRTAVAESKEEDLRTWSLQKLENEMNRLYQASISEVRLKDLPVSAIEPNVVKGKNTDGLRPTLYDLLAHQVLDYYLQENNFLTEPAYQFYVDDEAFFAEAKTFANKKIVAKDEQSRKLAALHIFQDLTKDHLEDVNPDALVDLDLKRLTFVYQNFVGGDKDVLYLDALNRLRKNYADSPVIAEVISKVAGVYMAKGSQYDPEDPSEKGKNANKKAVELLKEAIRTYPKTYGGDLCKEQLSSLKEMFVLAKVEGVYLPLKPGLIRLEYRNFQDVRLRVYKLKNPYKIFVHSYDEEWKDRVKGLRVVVEKNHHLQTEADYNRHSTELMMPSLPMGQYFLEVSDKEGLMSAYVAFQVSNLAIEKLDENRVEKYFMVLDRTKGTPITDAELISFRSINYDEIDIRHPKTSKTNRQGIAKLAKHHKEVRRYSVAVSRGLDLLVLQQSFYGNYYRDHSPKSEIHTEFFLDRAIYRPGQTVYFKALVLERDQDQIPHIQKSKSIDITLYNANQQKVKIVTLKTNEYGTVNGAFKLPSSGLNGNFSIQSSQNGWFGFRVEEYKRPKFEVKIDPPKKAFAIGEKVIVKGFGKNFSAVALDGATVKYVVNRQVRYPSWGGRYYWYNPAPPTQIAVGETVTNPDGSFEVHFDALPDRSVDPESKPNFNFNINVTVTDVTGEVHEASSVITVGYIAMQVAVDLPAQIDAKEWSKVKILTSNLNGEFEAAKGTVKLERLKSPEKYFISRYWKKPEYQLMSKAEFVKNYPNFAYGKEDEKENWSVSSQVFQKSFDTQVADNVSVPAGLRPGTYRMTLNTADKNNEKIEIVRIVELQGDSPEYVFNNIFNVRPIKSTVQPNEVAKIALASMVDIHYFVSTFRYKRGRVDDWEVVSHASKVVDYSVTEKDRGGFKTRISAVYKNRSFTKEVFFNVPWKNKELKISYETFRDKLYPGQKEKWRIKISGPKADAAAAEVVATMYDASLDQFVKNHWQTNYYPSRYYRSGWSPIEFGAYECQDNKYISVGGVMRKSYDYLTHLDLDSYGRRRMNKRFKAMPASASREDAEEVILQDSGSALGEVAVIAPQKEKKIVLDGIEGQTYKKDKFEIPADKQDASVTPRTNLNETVFFKPDLKTDADGNVILEFTMNEALTRWKLMTFAHDKEFRYAYVEKEVITQKELMVIPNPPRFLREFDEIEFSAKVVNLSEKDLQPNVELQLLDELHTMPVYKWLDNPQFNKVISVPKGRSTAVFFRFKVPSVGETPMIKWTLTASAGKYSDGESSYLPVVTNRMLVTETMPLPVKAKQKRIFVFKAMEKASESKTLENQGFTLEFTANPAWYAVQALPYIMEYPHECSEQVFSRLYANTLATSIANSHPRIKKVFEQWRTTDTDALASNLSKNQELKSALLEETPWVMNALSEEEQKKNIGLLFDLDRMAGEQEKAIHTLAERQSREGGFSWFPGGRKSWYITQYIVEGFGHLRKLGAMKKQEHPQAWKISEKAVKYIDNEFLKHYTELAKRVKKGHAKWENDHLDNMVIHYLYARSFFPDQKYPKHLQKPIDYYMGQAKKYYLGKGLYQEGLIALALQRNDEVKTAKEIMTSLRERSITNDELGMYWKQDYGYFWYQLPVETNALMIEAFDEIMNDEESVYQLKVWLLKNKQTTHWKTTKATASAVYALLMSGDNWLLEDQPISIKIGTMDVQPEKTEAGTGYFKQSWDKETMPSDPSHITIENPNAAIAWGAAYWQYFEDLDKIKIFKDTPLKLKKELFRETMSDRGSVLNKINVGDAIHVGDKLKMRIELRVDRAMEYVHMKDMRAAGFEPTNVLSRYKWQDGLGYYESTRDLATDFFFSYLRPGVYVFEYPLTAQLKGNFSNGVTTIQCMYAPEFSSHSEGVRVDVK